MTMIKTNIGTMPLEDYLDIKAQEYGFEDYDDLRSHGFVLTESEEKENAEK